MQLRKYQIEALAAIRHELTYRRSTLCILPTGCGKTILFCDLADKHGGRVLILAHREELVNQAADKCQAYTGFRPAIEMGNLRVEDAGFFGVHERIVVASKDSLHEGRIKKFARNEFDLIIIDEAHRSAKHNKTYSKIIEYFETAKVVGVTATADRRDGASVVGTVFESVAYEYKLLDAIHEGYLVPIKQQIVTVHGLDFSEAKTVARDFSDSDLERVLTEESILHKTAAPTVEIVGDRQTIVFCATIAHAEAMATVLNRYRNSSAVCITGNTAKEDRVGLISQFHKGQFQFLVGCDVFIEGFDCPPISAVVVCRPTKSRSRYVQMIGRGTRTVGMSGETVGERLSSIASSPKQDVLVLDYVGAANQLKLMISVADIIANHKDIDLPEKEKAEAIDRAKKRAMDGQLDLEKVIEEEVVKSKEEIEEEKQRRLAQKEAERNKIKARAEYSTREVNGFNKYDRSTHNGEQFSSRQPASLGQKRLLIALGVAPELVATYTKSEAGQSIGYLRKLGEREVWTRLRGVKI